MSSPSPTLIGAGLAEGRPSPRSPAHLFRVFNRLSLQGFGGVLAIAQRELVEREGWLTREEFVELLSVGQVLPGPNVVNLSLMIGNRFFGLRGAFAALAGMLVAPLAIVLLLAALFSQLSQQPQIAGALRGMGAVAAGLVLVTAFKFLATLRQSVLGPVLAGSLMLATLLATAWWRWPLPLVLAGLGPLGMWLAWRKLPPE